MTPDQMREFFTRLKGPEGCDFREDERGEGTWRCKGGTDLSLSTAILAKMRIPSAEAVAFLKDCQETGGFCDCEVIFNSADRLLSGWSAEEREEDAEQGEEEEQMDEQEYDDARRAEDAITGKARLWFCLQATTILGLVRGGSETLNALLDRAERVLVRPSGEAHFDSYDVDMQQVIGECEEAICHAYGTSLGDALNQLFNTFCDEGAWAVDVRE